MAFPLVDGTTGETTDVHAGMVVKRVRVATTGAGTLASDYENGDTVDGVVLATGNRILLKDQAAGATNGIYTVNASGAPTRALDFDESAEVLPNTIVVVSEGTANADTAWMLTTNATITLGTTALVFSQFAAPSGSSVVTAQTTRTTGDVVMNSTAAFTADVDTGMDLTVAAVAGDKVELQFHGSLGAEAVAVAFDFVTRVGGADVNFVSSGNGTPYTYGMPGSRGESGDDLSVNPSRIYTVQAGDISGGNVTFRLRYKTVAAANKTLYASAGTHAGASAKNFGQ